MPLGPKLLLMAAVMALVIGGHACGRSGTAPTPAPPPVDPEALLRESGRVMEDLDFFHFRLEHISGGTHLMPNLSIEEAEGDVINPDKISAEFSGTYGGFAIKSGLITLGAGSYMTNPLTGKWESLPTDVSPLGFFNPREGIASMMSQIDQVTLLSSGQQTHRLKGRLPAEALAPLVGTTVEGAIVGVELTIDAKDLYLVEAVFDGRVTPTEPDGTVRVIKLSRFGEPVAIEPPQ